MGYLGFDYFRIFNFRVVVGDVIYDIGNGRNKKEVKREVVVFVF